MAVKDILDRYEILLLVDDVQTGFGRTRRLFGIEHQEYEDGTEIEPDIMAMAKGIAGGFPLGALLRHPGCRLLWPGRTLSTFGGNPVSCAASIANIHVLMDEHLVEQSAERGRWGVGELSKHEERLLLIGDVRGPGLMIGVEHVRDRVNARAGSSRSGQRESAVSREKHSYRSWWPVWQCLANPAATGCQSE